MTDTNPLKKYFRAPGLYVTLPSRGAFNPDIVGSINGEIPVYPMTASDEVWSKNPDALLNGATVEHIIASCVPAVKNPRDLPAQDVDFLLLAIKKATYGEGLIVPGKCTHCGEVHEYSFPISEILEQAIPLEKNYSVSVDDIIINLRPYTYESTTKAQIATFEETKLFQNLMAAGINEESRIRLFSNSFEKVSRLNLEIISNTIVSIVTPEAEVTEQGFIKEFVLESPKKIIELIQAELDKFKDTGIAKKLGITCQACEESFELDVSFDPSHFFA